MNVKTKVIIGVALFAALLYFSRAANASTKTAGATATNTQNSTSKDSRLGASPVQTDKLAQPASGRVGTGFVSRVRAIAFDAFAPSAAFQNPCAEVGKNCRYPYATSARAADAAPLRPDYTPTSRSQFLSM